MADQQQLDPLEAARLALESALFRDNPNPWAVGIATGWVPVDGKPVGAQPPRKILIFVDPATPQCAWDAIRQQAEGLHQPAVLLRTGRFVGLANGGEGVGYAAPSQYNVPEVSVGTLALVTTPRGRFVLTSNHVLAHNGRVPQATPVVSPGLLDDSGGGAVIGNYSDCVPLQAPVWQLPASPLVAALRGTPANSVDCAVAAVAPGATINTTPIATVLNQVPYWTTVTKNGYATGTQTGIASVMACGTFIDFTFGTYWFQGMIGVFSPRGSNPPFAAPGDSGSVACTMAGEGAGLVTARAYVVDAAGGFVGYIILMCPLAAVQTALGAKLGQPVQFSR